MKFCLCYSSLGIFASIFVMVLGIVAQKINLSAVKICENMVVLSSQLTEGTQNPLRCHVFYGTSNSEKTINITLNSDTYITLGSLSTNTKYRAQIKCSENLFSKVVQFTTGFCSSSSELSIHTTTTSNGPVVLYKQREIISSSTLDIVLGIIFAVAALAILSVALYYYYRRCQRNQRLQRFYRTPHTDPFENLQDYIEGAT